MDLNFVPLDRLFQNKDLLECTELVPYVVDSNGMLWKQSIGQVFGSFFVTKSSLHLENCNKTANGGHFSLINRELRGFSSSAKELMGVSVKAGRLLPVMNSLLSN